MKKVQADCEVCKGLVDVKEMLFTKDGKVYLTLKCGHTIGYRFLGTIFIPPLRRT